MYVIWARKFVVGFLGQSYLRQKEVGWAPEAGQQNYVTTDTNRGIIRGIAPVTMLRRLSVGLLVSAIALAPLPTKAQDGTAEDLGDVMSISLKDVVKPTIGFQGALQGAGTPNQAGIGGFLPLSVGENSVWYLDALVNAHFGDRDGEAASSTPMLQVDFQRQRVWATAG